jgi:hypothetical protein
MIELVSTRRSTARSGIAPAEWATKLHKYRFASTVERPFCMNDATREQHGPAAAAQTNQTELAGASNCNCDALTIMTPLAKRHIAI